MKPALFWIAAATGNQYHEPWPTMFNIRLCYYPPSTWNIFIWSGVLQPWGPRTASSRYVISFRTCSGNIGDFSYKSKVYLVGVSFIFSSSSPQLFSFLLWLVETDEVDHDRRTCTTIWTLRLRFLTCSLGFRRIWLCAFNVGLPPPRLNMDWNLLDGVVWDEQSHVSLLFYTWLYSLWTYSL